MSGRVKIRRTGIAAPRALTETQARGVADDLPPCRFDADFYHDRYGSVPRGLDPLQHFLTIGWVQGRDPCASFSTFRYLTAHEDVLHRHINPYVHYRRFGEQEGRAVAPHTQESYLPRDDEIAAGLRAWFDEEFYLALYPELEGAPSLIDQYMVLGWTEGRDPCADFSSHKYLWKYADVMEASVNPLLHFVATGQKDGRRAEPSTGGRTELSRNLTPAQWRERVRAEFDAPFYAAEHPELSGLPDLFEHYHLTGWKLGYDPNPNFSVRRYLEQYKDIEASGADPFFHYVQHGRLEGRVSFPPEPEEARRERERNEAEAQLRAAFDEAYYRAQYPDVAGVADCFAHFMSIGWQEGRNPSRSFDTKFYLRHENDIRDAKINPFRHWVLHGKREGRRGCSSLNEMLASSDYAPKISVIVPNYNHARFLRERLRSITDQNYPNLEVILLDDASTDKSRDVLEEFQSSYAGACQLVVNAANSGNVFSQWQKGLALATGELVWICESDDFCAPDFLRNIVFLFQDPSIRIAFGNIQFVDEQGHVQPGMDSLREAASPGKWNEILIRPAAAWFAGPLGERNLMANVGGCLFRNTALPEDVWATARSYRVAGDWYLYVMLAAGGQIGYAPAATAYFRQHTSNTSVTAFADPGFYQEVARFHRFLRERWSIPLDTTFRFYRNLGEQFVISPLAADGRITDLVSFDSLASVNRRLTHIAVSLMNFDVGGGEIFPIALLNELHARGYLVSALVQTLQSDNDFVRGWLNPNIPVYVGKLYAESGYRMATDAQFDIIHSHNIWSEYYFLKTTRPPSSRYLVTLHGSYEVSEISEIDLTRFMAQARWVYLADRNLAKFRDFGLDTSAFRLVPNGFSRRLSATPETRKSLGISRKAVVFLFAARSHPDKGWMQAAKAFDMLTERGGLDTVLLMAGAGEEADKIRRSYGHNPRIRVLGFRNDVDDLLELADYLVLPTRFAGESMPLTLIQAFLAGKPAISTDVGHIRSMLECSAGKAGVVIPPLADEDAFVGALHEQLVAAACGRLAFDRAAFRHLADQFSMARCVDCYVTLYQEMLGQDQALVGLPVSVQLGEATSRRTEGSRAAGRRK